MTQSKAKKRIQQVNLTTGGKTVASKWMEYTSEEQEGNSKGKNIPLKLKKVSWKKKKVLIKEKGDNS